MRLFLRQASGMVSRRIATMAGTYLTAAGLSSDDVSTVLAAVPIIVGTAVDVAYSFLAAHRGWK